MAGYEDVVDEDGYHTKAERMSRSLVLSSMMDEVAAFTPAPKLWLSP